MTQFNSKKQQYMQTALLHKEFQPIYMNELHTGDEVISEDDMCFMYFGLQGTNNLYFATLKQYQNTWDIHDVAQVYIYESDQTATYEKIVHRFTPKQLKLLAFQFRPFIPAA